MREAEWYAEQGRRKQEAESARKARASRRESNPYNGGAMEV